MRRSTLAALAFTAALFATACEGPETTDMLDLQPAFGTVDSDCLTTLATLPAYPEGAYAGESKADLLAGIHDLIDPLFDTRNSRNSAHTHIDNVANKICADDYPAAEKMVWSFLLQVDQQIAGQPAKQVDPYPMEYAALTTRTFDLAWKEGDTKPLEVPAGAFRATGGIGAVDTRKGGAVSSRNNRAAAAVDPGTFDPGDQVIMVLSRGVGGTVMIPGFKSYPEGYMILSSVDEVDPSRPGVFVQMCLLDSYVPGSDYKTRVSLAHDMSGEGVLLDDVVWEDTPDNGLTIDCGGSEVVSNLHPTSPGWLRSLGRFADAAVRNVLMPARLFAQDDAEPSPTGGVGLGGRTKSFSPFAPVDLLGLELEVTLDNQADMSKEFRVTWTPSSGAPTECIADPRTTTSCYPSFSPGEEVTFTAETLWPTLPNSNVPGFDIWIEPGGDECPEHQQGSGFATCVFTMPLEPATIKFRNINGSGG